MSFNNNICSPLTGKANCQKVDRYDVNRIISNYKKAANIDVKPYFEDLNNIFLYKCLDTNIEFFVPTNIYGDDHFYQKLQRFEWYYMDNKWEYNKVLNYVTANDRVLEIGCGKGSFLKKIDSLTNSSVGLELNSETVKTIRNKGYEVYNEDVKEHAKNNMEYYDVVASFQVMEHVPNPKAVILSSLECLKKGGIYIISVPNNDAFIKYDRDNYLNIPPHHMLRWNVKSLSTLPNIFNLRLEKLFYEPLQNYHINWYSNILEQRFFKFERLKTLYKISNIKSLVNSYLEHMNYLIRGHTVLAVYKKQ